MSALHVIAVGTRSPAWVDAACRDYLRRFGRGLPARLALVAASARRAGVPVQRPCMAEGERLLRAVPATAQVIALDPRGEQVDSRVLAGQLERRLAAGPAAFLIGGADGLAPACLERACWRWSLSALTLPHLLVRVLVLEQLYRAYTILRGLPYHLRH